MKKIILSAFILSTLLGCGSNSKIVIPSYSAPKEWHKIEQLKHEEQSSSYLSFAINPSLTGYPSSMNTDEKSGLSKELIQQTISQLTAVRFITIEPIYELSLVKLDMGVDAFSYKQNDKERRAYIKTTFSLSKGSEPILVKSYSEKEFRYSKNGLDLPNKQEILAQLSESVVSQFISDISPTKTNQLREFLSLPSSLSHVVDAAKRGNFQSAINDMESSSADKDLNFYYNLAILYEAEASKKEDIVLAEKSMMAYEKSISKGGDAVKLVVSSKNRFEKYYRLLQTIKDQRSQNQQRKDEIDSQFLR